MKRSMLIMREIIIRPKEREKSQTLFSDGKNYTDDRYNGKFNSILINDKARKQNKDY